MIRSAAREKDVEWVQVGSRGSHDKWRLGATVQVAIPRHREINELTARAILASTERELGEGWWR
jgi:hypothetical protein